MVLEPDLARQQAERVGERSRDGGVAGLLRQLRRIELGERRLAGAQAHADADRADRLLEQR